MMQDELPATQTSPITAGFIAAVTGALTRSHEIRKVALDHLNRHATLLATWLVVGNAGALALVFKALVDGANCQPDMFQLAGARFALGLLFAFVGSAVFYGSSLASGVYLTSAIAALEEIHLHIATTQDPTAAEHEPELLETKARMKALKRRSTWVWRATAVSFAALAASALMFGLGASTPLSYPAETLKICAKSH